MDVHCLDIDNTTWLLNQNRNMEVDVDKGAVPKVLGVLSYSIA